MRTDPRFHRRSDAQGLMNPAKVVVHMEQRNHRNVIVEFFENAFVSRVKRRMFILMFKFWRST